MRKLALILALGSISVLTLSGCSQDPIKAVKSLVFKNLSSSVSIGTVLDTYKYCKPGTQNWTTFESTRKEKIVSFTCEDTRFPSDIKRLKSNLIEQEFDLINLGTIMARARGATDIPESMSTEKEIKDLRKKFEKFLGDSQEAKWSRNVAKYQWGIDIEAYFNDLDKLLKKCQAFNISQANFVVQFKQSIDNKREYQIGFVGHQVKYDDGKTADLNWGALSLSSTVYEGKSYSAYLENLGPFYWKDTLNEAYRESHQ